MRPRDAFIAGGIGGAPPNVVCITLHEVPGVAGDRLLAAFEPTIWRPSRRPWKSREIAGKNVRVSEGPGGRVWLWASDGLAITAASDGAIDERLVAGIGPKP